MQRSFVLDLSFTSSTRQGPDRSIMSRGSFWCRILIECLRVLDGDIRIPGQRFSCVPGQRWTLLQIIKLLLEGGLPQDQAHLGDMGIHLLRRDPPHSLYNQFSLISPSQPLSELYSCPPAIRSGLIIPLKTFNFLVQAFQSGNEG